MKFTGKFNVNGDWKSAFKMRYLVRQQHVNLLILSRRSRTTNRCLCSSAKPPSDQENKQVKDEKQERESKLAEAQSYEKWLASASQGAKSKFSQYKDTLFNWGSANKKPEEWYAERVSFWMKRYENFVGLTEVKAAQALVVREEKLFIQSQEQRRTAQTELSEVQSQLKALHTELERTHRGEDKYLELITEEHQIIKSETAIVESIRALERQEREQFSRLSNAVRDSHEKERAQAEKTKYWSVIGSVIGTCLGVIGTTVNNRLRMRELRQVVKDSVCVGKGQDPATTTTAAAAGSVSMAAASSAAVAEVLQIHEGKLETMSKNMKKVSEVLDSKLANLEKAVTKAVEASASKVFPVPLSNNNNNDPVPNAVELIELTRAVDQTVRVLDRGFNQLQGNLFQHNSTLVESLAATITARDDKFIQTLRKINNEAYETFSNRVYETDEKVKDVRSLILAQAMTASNDAKATTVLSSKVANQAETNKVLERSNKSILGTVENALKEHESRLQNQMLVTGVFMAVVTPLAIYVVNKIL